MAVAIGQALLTAGYIRPVSGSLQFSDSSDLYRYCANTGTLNAGTVPDSPSPSPEAEFLVLTFDRLCEEGVMGRLVMGSQGDGLQHLGQMLHLKAEAR